MKILLCLFLFLSSCTSYTEGNFRIKTFPDGKEYKATAISIVDEDDMIKFKTSEGKQTFSGSFEVYSE